MSEVATFAEGSAVEELIASACRTMDIESAGIKHLADAMHGPLGRAFAEAIELISQANGRVIVSGMGKSGQIGRKIASTLASTGTPAIYIHPGEASHGDLGIVTADDVIVVLSWSGETEELKDLVVHSGRFKVPLIAVTAGAESTLAHSADVVLRLPKHEEACPNGLAPTTSTTMQLVLGDALAVALLEQKGFTALDFKILHPGGKLGAALTFVREMMHTGAAVPLASADTAMSDAIVIMTEKSFGCLGVVDGAGKLIGIVTDGDLRRHMHDDLLATTAGTIMTPDPIVIEPEDLALAALEVINDAAITALFVVENGKPVGILHVHDLLRIGVA